MLQGFRRQLSMASPSTRPVWFNKSRATARAPVCCTTTTRFAYDFICFQSSVNSSLPGSTAWRCSSASVETAVTVPRHWRRPTYQSPSSLLLARPGDCRRQPSNSSILSAQRTYSELLRLLGHQRLFYSPLAWGEVRGFGEGQAPLPGNFFSIFGLQIATFGALWGLFLRFSGPF